MEYNHSWNEQKSFTDLYIIHKMRNFGNCVRKGNYKQGWTLTR